MTSEPVPICDLVPDVVHDWRHRPNRADGTPRRVRNGVLARDGYRCVDCSGTTDLEVDHIIPRAVGGSDHPANLRTLCRRCHRTKTRRRQRQAFDLDEP